MKITLKKFLVLLLAALMCVSVFTACGNEEETTEKPKETEAPEVTDGESETEQGEIQNPQEPLDLIKDSKSEFVLVINQYAQFINDKVAYMIQDAIETISGLEMPLAKDYDLFINSLDAITKSKYNMEIAWRENGGTPGKWADIEAIEASYDKSAPYEILIGNTDRPESARAIADLKGENEYILRLDGNKIVLVASSNKALIAGAEYLISEYLSVETNNLKIESLNKSATIEAPVVENPEVYYGMTQDEVDTAFGPVLDGLFTGKTQEVIYRSDLGKSIYMHFPDILYKDGVYYSYYISYGSPVEGAPATGLATSTNGWDWTYERQILNPEEPWEAGMCAFAGVWEDEDGIMYIVYEASSSDYPGSVGLAVSYDGGYTWIKEKPILKKDQFDSWCKMNIGTPDLYFKDGTWIVTFHGWGSATEGNNGGCQIGIAYGDNLRNLSTLIQDPIVPTMKDTAWSGTTGRRDVFFCDGYYYMVYEISTEDLPPDGYGGADWSHMFARSKDLVNWEITEGPQLPQSAPGFGHDGTNWCVIDGELYVFMRNRSNCTTAVKLVLSN